MVRDAYKQAENLISECRLRKSRTLGTKQFHLVEARNKMTRITDARKMTVFNIQTRQCQRNFLPLFVTECQTSYI